MSDGQYRTSLAARVARHLALGALAVAGSAEGAVQWTAVNWTVPANIDGLYINVQTRATGSAGSVVAGWDINPYSATSLTWFNATGTGMLRYPGVTSGSAGSLALGTIVGPAGSYGSGAVTVGSAPGNWKLNSANYFGFRFVASDGLTHYGWGKFEIGAAINGADRRITEIAWEDVAATPISVGDNGGGGAPYDPCAPFNPIANVGANALGVNSSTATNLDLGSCGVFYKANYYKFTAPATRNYDISTCAGTSATRLAVLDGCAAGSGVVVCGEACGSGSVLTLSATAGTVYYVVLGSADAAVDLPASYGVQITPWYSPCDASNPALGIATNSVSVNTTTAEDLDVATKSCNFTIYEANYFRYTPSASGTYTISTCSSGQATRMAVLDGCAAGASVLACDDGSCSGASTLTVELTATVAYYVVVGSPSAKSDLASPLAITVVPPPLPACVEAQPAIFGENPFANSGPSPQTVRSDAVGATTATMQRVVWYTFVPGATGNYSLKTCGSTGDTMLAIGDVCPGVGSRFEAIAYNDDAPNCSSGTGNLASCIDPNNCGATGIYAGFPLTQELTAGTTYYIAVGSFSATANVTGTLLIDGPPQGNPADLDGDGSVGAADLSVLLAAWGTPGPGDLDGDGSVGAADLALLLAAWG